MSRPIITMLVLFLCFLCSCSPKGTKGKQADEHYQRAVESLKQNEIEAALDEMEQTLQLNPKHEGVYLSFLQGYKFQRENNYPKAVENYLSFLNKEEIQTATTDEWQAELIRNATGNLAQVYFDWGMLSRSFFNSAINIELDYYNQEYALWKGKKLKSVNLDYNWYFRGLCLAYAQQYDDAIAAFKQIQPNSDIYPLAQLAMARCYSQTGKQKAVISVFQNLMQQVDSASRKDPVLFSSLSVFLTEFFPSRKKEGLAACEDAYSLVSQDGIKANVRNMVIRNLSQAYYNTAQIDKAWEALWRLDTKLPDFEDARGAKFFDPSLFQLQARIYLSKAIGYYQKVVEKVGEEKASSQLYQIGQSFLALGKYDEAISNFQNLLEKNFGKRLQALTMVSLGICYYKKGNKELAEELWNSALQAGQTSGDALIQSEVGYTFAQLGINFDLALALCTRTEAEVAKWGFLAANLGTVYLQMGIQERNRTRQAELFWQAIGQLSSQIGNSFDFRRGNWKTPLVLIELAKAYYLVNSFGTPTSIFRYFRDDYPEVEQLFTACQLTRENWRRIQWHAKYRPTEILWHDNWFAELY